MPEVIIVNDAVAQMRFARDDDVYYPHALQQYKLAIYCARYFQNPLSEVAALYNNPLDPDDCDLLRLELNPYQSVIPPSFLRKTLVMEICNELVSAGVVLQDVMAYLDGYCGCGMGVSSDSTHSVPSRLRLPQGARLRQQADGRRPEAAQPVGAAVGD